MKVRRVQRQVSLQRDGDSIRSAVAACSSHAAMAVPASQRLVAWNNWIVCVMGGLDAIPAFATQVSSRHSKSLAFRSCLARLNPDAVIPSSAVTVEQCLQPPHLS